jgi:hypothetical protein
MKLETRHRSRQTRQGFVLLAVLIFIFLLSMLGLSLLFRSQSGELAANATAGSEQAWSAAMSGVQEAMRIAASAPPGSSDWQDDPADFRQRLVYQDGADQWYFTVFSPAGSEALVKFRYGLTDEASRLNLNHPGGADLTKIPGTTPELAQAARDFIAAPVLGTGPSDAATPEAAALSALAEAPDVSAQAPSPSGIPDVPDAGAGLAGANAQVSDAGSALPGPGAAPHGALETVDELLLAPGFTWSLLHGGGAGLDGGSDPAEADADTGFPSANPDARPDPGLAQYFTVVSYDPNRTAAGQPRANLNDPNASLAAAGLPPAFTNYLAALRSAKQKLAHPADALEAALQVKDDKGVDVQIASGITKDELPLLLDLFSTEGAARHDGLVNVNTAGATVLAALPGMDEALAETIVSTRAGLPPERLASVAWLYQEGLVDADRFKTIAPSLTIRSSQFHFQVIGYGLPSGRYRVLDVVIDLAGAAPGILYLRDLTKLGLPLKLETEPSEASDAQSANSPSPAARLPANPHG